MPAAPPSLHSPAPVAANLPQPPPERKGLVLSAALLIVGVGLLALVLAGPLGGRRAQPGPPAIRIAPRPVPGPASSASASIVAQPPSAQQAADAARFARRGPTHVPARWEAGFYPLYETASRTYGLNWLLLASVHDQETAFSTAPSTYHGLNFVHCCGGPMQFNVTNGPPSTWQRVAFAYLDAPRPHGYNHQTAAHPSIYDDFDAMMAAGRLLALDGAGARLDSTAWAAAYAYYGHDATGVTYADQVLARAIGWSQRGFCINCTLDGHLVAAVHAAWGAPALAAPAKR